MKSTHLPRVSALMAVASMAASLVFASPAASAGPIIYVDIAAAGADDGSSWGDAFTDLQDALAVASFGDEIHVAEGTYRPHASDRTVSFELVDGVDLIGGYSTGGVAGPDPTLYETSLSGDLNADDLPGFVNNGENSYHVVLADSTVAMVALDGFTISGGNADGPSFNTSDWGAGLALFDAGTIALTRVNVSDNQAAANGGGVLNIGSDLAVTDSSIIRNEAGNIGAGVHNNGAGTVSFHRTVIADNNTDSTGGGIATLNTGALSLQDSFVVRNTAVVGGGIYGADSSVTIVDSMIALNTAGTGSATYHGGGAYFSEAHVSIINSVVLSNTGDGSGGGVYARIESTIEVVNSVVAKNTAGGGGGGIYLGELSNRGSSGLVINSVVTDNTGGGGIQTSDDSDVSVANSIVWKNSATGTEYLGTGTVAIDHSDVEGWRGGGVGNIDVDPQFVGPGNYRLQGTSPAREAGDNTAVPPDTFDVDGDGNTTEPTPDLDGRDRIAGIVDMGAYEMPLVSIVPGGFVANPEGDTGSTIYQMPVSLSQAEDVPVTVDWNTVDAAANPLIAQAGTDFVSNSGTVTFLPGETTKTIDIEVLGDTVDEPPLLYGEWGVVQFTNPSFAKLGGLFGLGFFIIIDDDP